MGLNDQRHKYRRFLLRNWKTATLKAAEFEIKAAQNKQLAAEIELQALKLQLDPHFVFII